MAIQHSRALPALTLASTRQCIISCKKPVQLSQRPACVWPIEVVCDRSAPARADCAVANQLSRALRTLTLASTRNCVISFQKPVQLAGRPACGWQNEGDCDRSDPARGDCAVANQHSRALRALVLASTRHCVISFEKPVQLAGRPACGWQNEGACDRSAPARGDCAVANQHSRALRALVLASTRQCVTSCKQPVQLSQRPACVWPIEVVCDRPAPARGDCAVANQLSRALRTLTLAGTRNCVISFEKPV